MSIAVTTSRKVNTKLKDVAFSIADELCCEYIVRGKQRIDEVFHLGYDVLIVVCPQRIKVLSLIEESVVEEFFFHPGMALIRLNRLQSGIGDNMVDSMGLCVGDSLLDCTLGMGSDAIVASYVVGESGRVVALESSPIIYAVVKRGLLSWCENPELVEPMRRIEVINTDYESYLKSTNDEYDVVYFDPMFECPIESSKGISPMRRFAKTGGVDVESFERAKDIARKSVVIKADVNSQMLEDLRIIATKGNRVGSFEYGILKRARG